MNKGFTLIELLVVVLIIGILAAVALPQYQKAVLKSRLASVLPAINAGEKALSIYLLENGYPSENTGCENLAIDLPEGITCSCQVFSATSKSCIVRALTEDFNMPSVALESIIQPNAWGFIDEYTDTEELAEPDRFYRRCFWYENEHVCDIAHDLGYYKEEG